MIHIVLPYFEFSIILDFAMPKKALRSLIIYLTSLIMAFCSF
jgi:hypothetical protein